MRHSHWTLWKRSTIRMSNPEGDGETETDVFEPEYDGTVIEDGEDDASTVMESDSSSESADDDHHVEKSEPQAAKPPEKGDDDSGYVEEPAAEEQVEGLIVDAVVEDEDENIEEVPPGESIDAHREVGKVMVDDSVEYCVEKILDYFVNKGKKDWFLVKWWGWASEYNTWEPTGNMTHAEEEIDKFFAQHPKKLISRDAVVNFLEAKKKKAEIRQAKVGKRKARNSNGQNPRTTKQRKSASKQASTSNGIDYRPGIITRSKSMPSNTQDKCQQKQGSPITRAKYRCPGCGDAATPPSPTAKNDNRRKPTGNGVPAKGKRSYGSDLNDKFSGSKKRKLASASVPVESQVGSANENAYLQRGVLTRAGGAKVYPEVKLLTGLEDSRRKKVSAGAGAGDQGNRNGAGSTSPHTQGAVAVVRTETGKHRARGSSVQTEVTEPEQDWLAIFHHARLQNVDWSLFSRPPSQNFHNWLHNGRLDDLHIHK